MGAHLIDGEFQSDKYPTCPRGKVPLSTKDPRVQDLLWEMAQRWRTVDAELTEDLEKALLAEGFTPSLLEEAIWTLVPLLRSTLSRVGLGGTLRFWRSAWPTSGRAKSSGAGAP